MEDALETGLRKNTTNGAGWLKKTLMWSIK